MAGHLKRAEECMLTMSCLSGRVRPCKMEAFPLLQVSFSQVAGWQLTKQLKMIKQSGTHLKQTP